MIKNMHSCKDSLPYIILLSLLTILYLITFPGEMTADSMMQYASAKSGVYSNHHPAVMSFVWRHLFWLHEGGGGMYLLHGLFLVSACGIFIKAFQQIPSVQKWPIYYYTVIALFPPILQFSMFIWKDVGMTFSFLLVSAILANSTLTKTPLHIGRLIVISTLLFYATAVKYQGQFILPVFCIWSAYNWLNNKTIARTLALGLILFTTIFGCVKLVDHVLVPPSQDSHSWQKVKIYDLAGISLDQNKAIFPDFILKNPNFDMARVGKLFNRYRVDELNFIDDTPTPDGKTQFERDELLKTWKEAVVAYPSSYFKTRLLMWIHNFTERPFKSAQSLTKSERLNTYFPFVSKYPWILKMIDLGLDTLKSIWFLPLVFVYIFIGAYNWRRTPAAPVLFFMNTAAATLALILFVFSMAATARYVYLTVVLLHFSHPFAWLIWRQYQSKRP